LKPSSAWILRAASMTPVYCVCPLRASTCSRVLMTSAGVTSDAAGMPASAPASSSDHGEL
jgi:hypothetical protein